MTLSKHTQNAMLQLPTQTKGDQFTEEYGLGATDKLLAVTVACAQNVLADLTQT